jgi:hypothetical protein
MGRVGDLEIEESVGPSRPQKGELFVCVCVCVCAHARVCVTGDSTQGLVLAMP